MAKRAKSVAARRDKALDEKSQIAWTTERNPALGLKPLEHGPGRLIDGRDLVLGYGEEAIIRGLDLTLEAGERLAVKGPNGCGKSLLVSVLTGGAGRVLSGRLTLAPRLVVSGLAQRNYLEKGTVRDFCQKNGSSETLVKTLLNYLGFGKGDLEKNLENLSDGQKRKAHLALALAQSAHLYVWDEPLNFLDLFSRTQLEDLILKDRPTMVFVEHDLTFMEKVATRELDLTPFSREFFDKSR